jgi:hypothetical protein
MPLYAEVGDTLGRANCIQSLGDIAEAEGDRKAAEARFREALGLYSQIPEPYSMGWAHVRLARMAGYEAGRGGHVREARRLWESIDRPDLVEGLRKAFGVLAGD